MVGDTRRSLVLAPGILLLNAFNYKSGGSMAEQQQIKPLEEFVLSGLLARYQQVFGCLCAYVTAVDKIKVIERLFEGKTPSYPYALLTLTGVTRNMESYNPHSMARRGLVVDVGQGQAITTRVIPANFEIEIEYHTDKYKGFTGNSVLAYTRRWMFAQRMGYLKFNTRYGRIMFSTGATLADISGIPVRDSATDAETVYKLPSTLTLHGYVSEPTIGTVGIIDSIDLEQGVQDNPNSQFFPF